MGLDWNPLARPKEGNEEEFERLFRALEDGAEGDDREKLLERFRTISQPPFELLGAPRVGMDAAADEWLRETLRENDKLDELDRVRESMRGYYVLDLLPPCDGFPIYTHYGQYDGLDRYSFRGKFLDDVEDVIGQELYELAYERMLAADLEDYGKKLMTAARTFVESRGIAEPTEPPEEFGSDASRAHILFSAARWCLYWAQRGHGLDPWF